MRNTFRNQFITCISLKQLVYGLLLEKVPENYKKEDQREFVLTLI